MTVTTEDTTAPEVLEGEVVNDTADQPGEVAGGSENAPEPAPKAKRAAKAKAGAKAPSKAVAKKEAKPVEKSELTPGDARKLTARLRTGLENSIELFVTAYSKRIWLALGHASWQEYLDAELGDLRVSFPREDRKRMVAQMVQPPSKMSTRAIASALGSTRRPCPTTSRELRAEGVISVPSTRVGVDGVEAVGREGGAHRRPGEGRREVRGAGHAGVRKAGRLRRGPDRPLQRRPVGAGGRADRPASPRRHGPSAGLAQPGPEPHPRRGGVARQRGRTVTTIRPSGLACPCTAKQPPLLASRRVPGLRPRFHS
jgi:hypothetical protein